jgi:beta-galactosidase
MSRSSFNLDWSVAPNVSVFSEITGGSTSAEAVTLPHDAMLSQPRRAEAEGGSATGYFEGGAVSYRKEFNAPAEWADRVIELEFDGVYRDAMVYLNGVLVGQRPNGYSPFRVRLDSALKYGQRNRLRVDARAHRDSRWYSGLGIYRDVWLHELPLTHIVPGGVCVTTPDVDDERAVVEVAVEVANERRAPSTRDLRVGILDAAGAEVASGEATVTVRPGETAVARLRLYVTGPQRWSTDSPTLYELSATLRRGEETDDEVALAFGIRTLQLDPQHGLRINGVATDLRGACVHHDNGILGAVSIAEAEDRRVRILKSAGFNAIRSSHNTIAPTLLDACDRLGMLVIDEAFDMWTEGKQPFDYSLNFTEWWRRDLAAMGRKDRNHPSVIMYSIGNEILDAGKPLGAAIGRDLAEEVRALDPTRFLTNGISGFVATLSETVPDIQAELAGVPGGINDAQGVGKAILDRVSRSEFVTSATAESHGIVDVAGHNYAAWRYEAERERFPNRVVVGTETNPKDIAENWALVTRMPWVLGDFTWTGWDYLGEAGLGAVSYPAGGEGWDADRYPALLAFCGDIDITGFRRPASYFREIVFGLRADPYLAVHRPRPDGRAPAVLDWAWTDSVSEWSFDVAAGTPMTVDVYSDAEEVELTLNGAVIGRRPSGAEHGYLASFTVPYARGELVAVNRRQGEPAESTAIQSCGPAAQVRVWIEEQARQSPREYTYVAIELIDANGSVVPFDDRVVSVVVTGGARLSGLGSARPVTEASYLDDTCRTYLGRAQAIVRSTAGAAGEVVVHVDGLPGVRIPI